MYKTVLSRPPLFPKEVVGVDIPGYMAAPASPVSHHQHHGPRSQGASSLGLIFQPLSSVFFFFYYHNCLFLIIFFSFRSLLIRRALKFCKSFAITWSEKTVFNRNRCSKQMTGEQHKHSKVYPGIHSTSSSFTRCNICIFDRFWKNSLPLISPVMFLKPH